MGKLPVWTPVPPLLRHAAGVNFCLESAPPSRLGALSRRFVLAFRAPFVVSSRRGLITSL
jgi:hypothetical protein